MSKNKRDEKERWADIEKYEGYYQISNYGNVKSLDRTVIQKNKYGMEMVRLLKGVLLTPTDNGNGYLIIGLTKDGFRKNHYIHRLVAHHFVKPIPDGYVTNHKDYNTYNNYYKNLGVTTQKQNIKYSQRRMQKPRMTFNDDTYIRKRKHGFEVTVSYKYIGKYNCINEAREARNKEMRRRADYFKQLGELYEKYIAE